MRDLSLFCSLCRLAFLKHVAFAFSTGVNM